MAPKSLPPIAKQNLVLSYFHKSRTAHSLKELEKHLPTVASINGMQVKDYLQALTDEGKIRVEKIGSGNWYWSFLSDEKKTKEKMLESLRAEKVKVVEMVTNLQQKIEEATGARAVNDEDEDAANKGQDRASLTLSHAALQKEVDTYRQELLSLDQNDPVEVLKKKEATEKLIAEARLWSDNIYLLESFLLEMTGNDRSQLESFQAAYYGDQYQEDEGLKDI
ncbi:MAG: hypothetical protein M1829_004313 [Trizodia sp. TS-e1964]|nr:MAG: hypothetical protein M1829_004313 [Trizodia sp. TS-e1964]